MVPICRTVLGLQIVESFRYASNTSLRSQRWFFRLRIRHAHLGRCRHPRATLFTTIALHHFRSIDPYNPASHQKIVHHYTSRLSWDAQRAWRRQPPQKPCTYICLPFFCVGTSNVCVSFGWRQPITLRHVVVRQCLDTINGIVSPFFVRQPSSLASFALPSQCQISDQLGALPALSSPYSLSGAQPTSHPPP